MSLYDELKRELARHGLGDIPLYVCTRDVRYEHHPNTIMALRSLDEAIERMIEAEQNRLRLTQSGVSDSHC